MTLAALVLAAGRGSRLRPLTDTTPKPLLEVGGMTLLDRALALVATVVPLSCHDVAVNAHWLADQVTAHIGHRAHVSIESAEALGTAGAVGGIHDWLDGRDLLIANGDAFYHPTPDLLSFVAGWDRRRPRLLVVADSQRSDFDGGWRFAGLSLLPGMRAAALPARPQGLFEAVWRHEPCDRVPTDVTFIDCGTPADLELARSLR